ncbi:MAG: hypothetical protein ACOYN3_03165 [Acidimicrobiia bacterium]
METMTYPEFSTELNRNNPDALASAYRAIYAGRPAGALDLAFVDYLAACQLGGRGDRVGAAQHLQRVIDFSNTSGEPRPAELARQAAAQMGITLPPQGSGLGPAMSGPDFGPQFGPVTSA